MTTKLTVRLDAELAKRLRLLAVRDDKTVQEIVARLVGDYVVRGERGLAAGEGDRTGPHGEGVRSGTHQPLRPPAASPSVRPDFKKGK